LSSFALKSRDFEKPEIESFSIWTNIRQAGIFESIFKGYILQIRIYRVGV
jgi:hypothetical protein